MYYYGLYRGAVVDNQDPEQRKRLKVQIPQILGKSISPWALSCLPNSGGSVPVVGAIVWVMFEGGDADRPVWIGVLPTS
jgi:uncharacterized protein involved in type VI secretion and phage assembly